MKIRVAGRHDRWLPLPTGTHITPRVKHCMTAYHQLWGPHPLREGPTRDMAMAMLNFHLPRLERAEEAEYYAFVRRCVARAAPSSQKILSKKHEKKLK